MQQSTRNYEWAVFVVPFVLYLLGTSSIGSLGVPYPIGYVGVCMACGIVTAALLWKFSVLKPHWDLLPAVAVGLIGIVLWIALSSLHLEKYVLVMLPNWLRPESRVAFNPFEQMDSIALAWGFVAARMIGLAIIVPIAEELFWRGFLLRWLEKEDWRSVKIGEFGLQSGAIVVLLFTLAHPEWLAACVYCSLLNGYFWLKKDLWGCVVAHAVSNGMLGIYVLTTASWQLW